MDEFTHDFASIHHPGAPHMNGGPATTQAAQQQARVQGASGYPNASTAQSQHVLIPTGASTMASQPSMQEVQRENGELKGQVKHLEGRLQRFQAETKAKMQDIQSQHVAELERVNERHAKLENDFTAARSVLEQLQGALQGLNDSNERGPAGSLLSTLANFLSSDSHPSINVPQNGADANGKSTRRKRPRASMPERSSRAGAADESGASTSNNLLTPARAKRPRHSTPNTGNRKRKNQEFQSPFQGPNADRARVAMLKGPKPGQNASNDDSQVASPIGSGDEVNLAIPNASFVQQGEPDRSGAAGPQSQQQRGQAPPPPVSASEAAFYPDPFNLEGPSSSNAAETASQIAAAAIVRNAAHASGAPSGGTSQANDAADGQQLQSGQDVSFVGGMDDDADPLTELPIPRVKEVKDVVKQWEEGDTSVGMRPLKDWTLRMQNHPRYLSTFADRKRIYEAYKRCGSSMEAFENEYGKGKALKEYKAAIQQKGKEKGFVRQRAPRGSTKGEHAQEDGQTNEDGTSAADNQQAQARPPQDRQQQQGSTNESESFLQDVIHPDLTGSS